jgi:hypothetical protein
MHEQKSERTLLANCKRPIFAPFLPFLALLNGYVHSSRRRTITTMPLH